MLADIDGVVKLLAVPNATPPVGFAYHFIVPVEETALNVTVPVPHLPAGVVAVMLGSGVTDTTTSLLIEHPVAVIVSVSEYVVVETGLAEGCASVALLNVAAGVQAYVFPAVAAAPKVTLPDPQMF